MRSRLRPASRHRRLAAALVAPFACLLLAGPAHAAEGTWERAWGKDVIQSGAPGDTGAGFEICTAAAGCKAGASGGLGGELDEPTGVATDAAGALYVPDFNNDRIQKFDSEGNFLRAWGKDVIQSGASGDTGAGFEICTAAADCKAGASGGLGGEFNFPEGVATDEAGAVYVADEVNHRIQRFDSAGNFQRAWGRDVIQSGEPGDTGTEFEICTGAADCKAGTSGGLGGQFTFPFGVATDAEGAVYVADLSNHRIQKFDSAGNFQRAWGKDVIQSAAPGNTGTGFEICTVATDCKVGGSGGLGGELNQPPSIATDAAGAVYVADQGNRRIQKFDSAGNFQRTWGKDVIQSGAPGDTGTGFEICTGAADCQAGTIGGLGGELDSPEGVGTGAAGAVYVADTSNHRIQRFADPSPPPPPPPPDGEAAPAKADRTLTLDANKGKVEKGRKVRLSGQLDAPGNDPACEQGQSVEILRTGLKGGAPKPVATEQTDAQGNFATKVKVKKSSLYTARVAETPACEPESSDTEKVRVQKPQAAEEA
jgi:DNA-binding beta-propeller fold protein YncE